MRFKFLLIVWFSCLFCTQIFAETEPNDTRAQANTLTLNGNSSGTIGTATDVDWYKVTTNGDGRLDLSLTASNGLYTWFALYDNNGTTLLRQEYTNSSFSYSVDGLAAGTYYVKIFPYYAGQLPNYSISNTLTKPTIANDTEPNSTLATAKTLTLNSTVTGHVGYYYNNLRDTFDYYKVTTTADGRIQLKITSGNGQNLYATLIDAQGTIVLNSQYTTGTLDINTDGLAAGTYYVRINTFYTSSEFTPYTLVNSLLSPTEANDVEPNNTKAQALTLPLNSSKTGHVNYYYNNLKDSSDWYKIVTNGDGRLRLRIKSGNGQNVWAYLFDNNGTTQLNAGYTTSTLDINTDGLAAGTYYVRVNTYYTNEFAPYTLSDSLFKPTQTNDTEPNDSKAAALTLNVNSTVTGHTNYYYNGKKDSSDWYKLTTTQDGMLKIKLTSANGQNVWAYLLDNDGTTVIASQYTTSSLNYNVDALAAGTYYLRVNTYYTNEFAPYTLTDSLYTYSTNDAEPNKYAKQAATLPANQATTGHIGFYYNKVRDTVDWHKINYTGNGNLTLTYTLAAHKSDGSTNYGYIQVYKDTNAAPIFNNYYSGTQPNVINLSSLAQGYYYIKVFEYYNSNFDAYSITPTFTQTAVAAIKPTAYDTAAVCASTNSITYSCSKSKAPYTIQLYRFGVAYGSPVSTKKTYTFTNLPVGSYYAVVYGDGATGTAFGKSKNTSVEPIPTGLSTTNITATQAKLNWTAVTCADYFSIQYKLHSATTWTAKRTNGNVSSYILKGLTANKVYDWRIAAVDSLNSIIATGVYADSISFTTAAALIAGEGNDDNDALTLNNNKLSLVEVKASPNPASSYFVIQSAAVNGNITAQLKDLSGRIQWTSGAVAGSNLAGIRVNVNNLAAGVYVLELINDKGSLHATTKVMVVK